MDIKLLEILLALLAAVVGWVIAIRQYYLNNGESNLEKELNRLREAYKAIDRGPIYYKTPFVVYPLSITNEYRVSFLQISKRQMSYSIDVSLSVYDNFYAYIQNAVCYIGDTELTLRQMLILYDVFVENIVQRDLIDQTFQVMYYSIMKAVAKKLLRR